MLAWERKEELLSLAKELIFRERSGSLGWPIKNVLKA